MPNLTTVFRSAFAGDCIQPGFACQDRVAALSKEWRTKYAQAFDSRCCGSRNCEFDCQSTNGSAYADANGVLDVQKLTCAQLAATWQDADALSAWYSGWYNGLAKKHYYLVDSTKRLEHELIEYCKAHRGIRIIVAIAVVFKGVRARLGIKMKPSRRRSVRCAPSDGVKRRAGGLALAGPEPLRMCHIEQLWWNHGLPALQSSFNC
jgi:hypothetical protein